MRRKKIMRKRKKANKSLEANGELNEKYPGGIEKQKSLLEAEGHTIVQKGRKHFKYYVKDYEKQLYSIE